MNNLLPSFRRSALPALALLSACVSAGSDLGFGPEETRVVGLDVYLDRDGSRTPTAVLDTLYRGARVALFVRGSQDTFKVATTNTIGRALFTGVPMGQYRVAVVPSSIGDSIEVQSILIDGLIDTNEVSVTFTEDTTFALARLGYPEFSIREARSLPIGRRVFIRGVILSGVQSFRDTTSHITDSSLAIRLTRVALKGGLTGNNPGDSVSVLGVTATRAGQPTLDNASISRFNTRPEPVALPVSTGTAATAANGGLDAALIRLTGARILDTATISPDFRVTISDGTGSLRMILDANIPFPRTLFAPDRTMQAVGVLVPDGVGGWVIKPRGLGDVILN